MGRHTKVHADIFYAPRMPPTPRSGGDRESFRGNSSKKMNFAHFLDVSARSGSRELRAVKIPASYDAWRPPKRQKNDSEKNCFFLVSEVCEKSELSKKAQGLSKKAPGLSKRPVRVGGMALAGGEGREGNIHTSLFITHIP